MKTCFKCKRTQPLANYYQHARMGDGHLNKCKDCTKRDSLERYNVLVDDENWLEKERKRGREKYHKYGYRSSRTKSTNWLSRYPEKKLASQRAQNLVRPFEGAESHHWSYNEEHFKDVVWLTKKDHMKCHRFIKYDQTCKMYRRKDNNELLSTKLDHEFFIRHCIETKED